MWQITDDFLEIVKDRGLTIEEVMQVLDASSSKWVENRGQADTGITGHTADGKCIYIPIEDGDSEQEFLRPVTVFVLAEPRVLMGEHHIRRERWERRKRRS